MDCTSTRLPYRQANQFTRIVLDYLDHAESLKPFSTCPPSLQGIQKAIDNRKKFNTDRETLVQELRKQYKPLGALPAVQKNIDSLRSENTFTITTAHQPNIFTGPLFFIYKILHAIKLAAHCKSSLPGYDFIPVFYMGSEDADFDELGHFYINGEKWTWNTKQTGAVGRMKVDKEYTKLIESISGQLTVLPNGDEILALVKDCYSEGMMIQEATFKLLNSLFGEFGLLVLIPDNPALKKQMTKLFADDLLNQTPSDIVQNSAAKLQASGYKMQANPREVNLFYLKENTRDRIVKLNGKYITHDKKLKFSEDELLKELQDYPERFSPNVILRGIFQETILPDIAYLGGGGEIAYWLQLKELFDHYNVPFPVLLLRNSFFVVEKKWKQKIGKLGFTVEDFFLSEQELLNRLVSRETKNEIKLNGQFDKASQLYEELKKQVANIDITLAEHVEALRTTSLRRLHELEKKMLRAEKRRFEEQQRQIHSIKEKLFPKNSLQERIDNFMYYYAKWGKDFIIKLHEHSLALEQEFVILLEK